MASNILGMSKFSACFREVTKRKEWQEMQEKRIERGQLRARFKDDKRPFGPDGLSTS